MSFFPATASHSTGGCRRWFAHLAGMCLVVLTSTEAFAFSCVSVAGSVNWNDTTTWTTCNGTVPQDGDTVSIPIGSTVALSATTNNLASLTVNGTLTNAGNPGRDVYMSGNVVNNGTIDFQASAGVNTFYLAGSGITSTFSGTGTWLLDSIDIDGSGGGPKSCTGTCRVELSGSPNLQLKATAPFAGLSATKTFNAGSNSTATVTLNLAGSQSIPTDNATYPNLVLAGTGVKTPASGSLFVLGGLTVSANTVFNSDTNDPFISVSGATTIANNGTYTASNSGFTAFRGNFTNNGTYTGNAGSVSVGGNFTNTNSFTSGAGTWTFSASSPQQITGTPTFENLTLSNATGLTLATGNVTVSTVLTLSSGVITTGGNTLITSASCPTSVSRGGGGGWINGNLRLNFPATNPVTCIFHVGSTTNYSPISVTKTGTNSGTLTGTTTSGDHADTGLGTSGINASKSVNRNWTLTGGTLASGTPYTATFQFCAAAGTGCSGSDIDVGAATASFIVAKKTSGTWSLPTVGTKTATSTQATGLSSFGEFAVGEAASSFHHLELQGSATGLTCAASTLTIMACADSGSPCTAYTGGVTGTLTATGVPTVNWDGTTGGASGAGFVISAGSSTVTKNFQLAAAGSVVFGTTSVSPAPSNATTCNFGSPSCTFTAATAGFIFSSSSTGGSYTIPAQTAGTATAASAIYLRAVQASTTNPAVCTPAIISQTSVAVTLGYTCNNPASCQGGNNLTVNSTSVPAGGGSVSLDFDANGSSAITLRYDDAGQITVNASKSITPFVGATTVSLTGSSNAFIVAPASFAITPSSSPYVAGTSFSATVTAKNSLGNTTPNYGLESAAETVVLKAVAAATASATNSELVGPAGGVTGTLTAGAFALGNCSPTAAGALCASNLAWTEVGDVKLAAARGSGGYLGSSLTPFGASATLTFKPAYLITALDTTQPCTSFTYSGQPFRIKVTAMRAANTAAFGGGDVAAITQNYTGSHAKTVTLGSDDAGVCTPTTTGFSNNTLADTEFTAAHPTTPGAASTAPVTNTVAPLPISYAQTLGAPASVTVCAKDTDGVNSHGQTQAVLAIRNGRLKLSNAFGSEKLALAMPMQTQYYVGGVWQTNTNDSCTSLAAPTITTSIPTVTASPAAPGVAASGLFSLSLTASAVGYADMTFSAPDWLKFNWTGSGATYPSARAGFGVYNQQGKSNKIIYRREVR